MAEKKENLTPEQCLQEALVPCTEWPYKLPENWCWVKLKTITNFERGITFPASAKEYEQTDSNIPCLRTANVQEKLEIDDLIFVNKSFIKENTNKLVHLEDIIMSSANSRELVGKTSFVDCVPFPMTFGGFVLNIRASNISSRFLFYYLRLEFLSGNFMGKSTQTTNISNINTTTLGKYSFPLPPLSEQQRIVDRIESLFSRLDEAKEKAQAALDSFESRKAAILHKAFTGELTAKWREEHRVGMESWKSTTVSNVCNDIKVGIVIKPSQYYTNASNGTPAFRSANVREGHIDNFDWVYLDADGMEANKRSIVHTGDVLVVRSGYPGTACVVTDEFDGYNAIDVLIAVPNKTDILSEYLCHYTNSPFGKNAVALNKRGVAQAHYNVKGYSIAPINVPSLAEQSEIICIIDSLLTKEQKSKEAAEAVLEQIELIKKSILSRAFRGELGTNDPREPSSKALLKEIIEEER